MVIKQECNYARSLLVARGASSLLRLLSLRAQDLEITNKIDVMAKM